VYNFQIQTSPRLVNSIYAYGEKLNKKEPKLTTHSDTYTYMFCAVSTGKVQNRSKNNTVSANRPTRNSSKDNHVRLSHVIRQSPTNCAQFHAKRGTAYNRPRSISVYQVRPLVGLNALNEHIFLSQKWSLRLQNELSAKHLNFGGKRRRPWSQFTPASPVAVAPKTSVALVL